MRIRKFIKVIFVGQGTGGGGGMRIRKFISKSQPGGGGGGRGRVTEGAQLRRLVVAGVAVGVDLHLNRGQV